MRYEYFRDTIVALEAFKADQSDWSTENTAKQWATAYDFPAVAGKRVSIRRNSGSQRAASMQAFVLNIAPRHVQGSARCAGRSTTRSISRR